ncbi:MAG TPA: glycerol-3-phosphate 1-O-acyltransferase PlsY [Vicinamibacteria bacterium]|nr:glycerol-3-phosphate 1-O-acyltransferase PlsY [Vicinamibacteria bacterium]
MWPAIAVVAASYLLGSIPFSFLIARAFGVRDVRRVGSGNVGATNVLRSAGKAAGLLAFLLDAAKGAMATLLAQQVLPGDDRLPALAALLVVVGHMYPVWLRFQGGKGVATGFGALGPLAPWPALWAVSAFVVVAALTRYVSLGSIAGAVVLAALASALGTCPRPVAVAAVLAGALVVFRHRSNLHRLLAGTERRAAQPKE